MMNSQIRRERGGLLTPRPEYRDCSEPVNSGAPQQLVTLLADVSGSMDGTPIEQVNKGALDFARDLSGDPLTRATVQIQLVTFGGTVECYRFVPVTRFSPPKLVAGGGTPEAEALLEAIASTDRHSQFLRAAADVDILKAHYFLCSDGCSSSPGTVLREAATAIRQRERTRQGAFYAFGVDQAAVDALQPLFVRPVHLLGDNNFANFFRILSVSVRRVSATSVCEDLDLTPVINTLLRIPFERDDDA